MCVCVATRKAVQRFYDSAIIINIK